MLSEYFSVLGVGEKEAEVYLTLIELGQAGASLLAKQSGIKRSSVYTHLQSLQAKGLATQSVGKDAAVFQASPPEAIARMVERDAEQQRRELESKQRSADLLTEMLGSYFVDAAYTPPTMEFFEGASKVEDMLWQCCDEWQRSISTKDFVWWGYQDHQFVEQYRTWLDHYWARLKAR